MARDGDRLTRLTLVVCVVGVAACSSDGRPGVDSDPAPPARSTIQEPDADPTTSPPTTTTATPTTTVPTTITPTTTTASTTTTTARAAGTTPYVVPVADAAAAAWGETHAGYPASDVFVGCGAPVASPVNGTVIESRRVDQYDPNVDNPATRGGRSVTIVGDDGVRYYLAHFDTILETLEPGVRVLVGQPLGTMGDTGRASACHTHFGISPPCPGKEWSVRRGVVWPFPYLDDWRNGGQRSPVDEVTQWSADHPTACADAMADPDADDA